MGTLNQAVVASQAAPLTENLGEIHSRRKVGVEIVRSAELGSPFFHGPQPGRNFPVRDDNEDWLRRVEEASALPMNAGPMRGFQKGRPESERRGTWDAIRPGLEDV